MLCYFCYVGVNWCLNLFSFPYFLLKKKWHINNRVGWAIERIVEAIATTQPTCGFLQFHHHLTTFVWSSTWRRTSISTWLEQCVCGLIFYNIDVRLDYFHENIYIELKVETSSNSSVFFFGWIHVVKLFFHSHLECLTHSLLHFSVFFWVDSCC